MIKYLIIFVFILCFIVLCISIYEIIYDKDLIAKFYIVGIQLLIIIYTTIKLKEL